MKTIFSLCLLTISYFSLAQLQFADIGSESAFCRLHDWQSGNGVVFAAPSGGTPPYTYLWENLTTGQTASNSTWGGLNPDDYHIIIWDSLNDSIFQIVTVDSINPDVSFNVVSSGLTPQGNDFYWGEAAVDVDFENTSTGIYNFNNPNSDTTFLWQMTQFEDWHQTDYSTESFTYSFGGTWGVTLIGINKNGCSDTAKAHIWLNGPASVNENQFEMDIINLENSLQILMSQPDEYVVEVYDVQGRLMQHKSCLGESAILNFQSDGIIIVSVRNKEGIEIRKKIQLN
jgi:hypothetical protein